MTTEQGQNAEARCAYLRGSLAPAVLDRIPESELREELQRARTAYYCPERRAAMFASLQRRNPAHAALVHHVTGAIERGDAEPVQEIRTFSDGQRGVLLGWHR